MLTSDRIHAIMGNNIRYLFTSHPGSQRDFAQKNYLSESSVSAWGRKTLPSTENLIRLADYFGIDIGWFCEEHELLRS
ncbi:MAG: helix-turn-helix domain-containing protein [Clostridiales bacterium]|nr:helix-turn-helix domain-containing protein [Clostridiales bacterium]